MKKLIWIIIITATLPAFAQKKVKNGVIYKEHPNLETMKRLAVLYGQGDTAAMAKLFADSAKVYGMTRYDVDTTKVAQWSVPPAKSLAEAKAGWRQIFDNWDHVSMKPIGQADGLEYTNARFTVQSWWLLSLINKKTKKTAKVEMVLFDIFNPDGKIAVQVGFYDPTSLIAAAK